MNLTVLSSQLDSLFAYTEFNSIRIEKMCHL